MQSQMRPKHMSVAGPAACLVWQSDGVKKYCRTLLRMCMFKIMFNNHKRSSMLRCPGDKPRSQNWRTGSSSGPTCNTCSKLNRAVNRNGADNEARQETEKRQLYGLLVYHNISAVRDSPANTNKQHTEEVRKVWADMLSQRSRNSCCLEPTVVGLVACSHELLGERTWTPFWLCCKMKQKLKEMDLEDDDCISIM